jgi:hypothetical protein
MLVTYLAFFLDFCQGYGLTHKRCYQGGIVASEIMLPRGGMTRGGVKECIKAVRGRYLRAARKDTGRILDEVVQVTGYHRKAAIRLLSCAAWTT